MTHGLSKCRIGWQARIFDRVRKSAFAVTCYMVVFNVACGTSPEPSFIETESGATSGEILDSSDAGVGTLTSKATTDSSVSDSLTGESTSASESAGVTSESESTTGTSTSGTEAESCTVDSTDGSDTSDASSTVSPTASSSTTGVETDTGTSDTDSSDTDSSDTDSSDTDEPGLDHPLLLTVTDAKSAENWRIQLTQVSRNPKLHMSVFRDVPFNASQPQVVVEAPRNDLEDGSLGIKSIRLIPTVYIDRNLNEQFDEGEMILGAVDGVFRFVYSPLGEYWEHRNGANIAEFMDTNPTEGFQVTLPLVYVQGRKPRSKGQVLWGIHEYMNMDVTPKSSAFVAMVSPKEYLDPSVIETEKERHVYVVLDRNEKRWTLEQEHYSFMAEPGKLMEWGTVIDDVAPHAFQLLLTYDDAGMIVGKLDAEDKVVASPCGAYNRTIIGLWIDPKSNLFENAHGAWAVAAYDLYPGWNLHSVKLNRESDSQLSVSDWGAGFRVDMQSTDTEIGIFTHPEFCLPEGHAL